MANIITKEQFQDQYDLKKYYQQLYEKAILDINQLKSDNDKLLKQAVATQAEHKKEVTKLKNCPKTEIEELKAKLAKSESDLYKMIRDGAFSKIEDPRANEHILINIIDAAGPSMDGKAYNIIDHVKILRLFYDENKFNA